MAVQDAVPTLEEEFQRLLASGGEAAARNELEPAREALEDALAIHARDPKVLGLLGQVYYRLGRYQDAAGAWQRLVDDNPVEPGARVNLGLAWLKARQYPQAIKQLRIALDLNPEHRKAAGYLGLAWLEVGEPAKAREWFVRAGSEQMVTRCDELLAAPATPPPVAAEPDLVEPPVTAESDFVEPPTAEVRLAEVAPPEVPVSEVALAEDPAAPAPLTPSDLAAAFEAAQEPEPAREPEQEPEQAAAVEAEPAAPPPAEEPEEQSPPPVEEQSPPPVDDGPAATPGLLTLTGFADAHVVAGPGGQPFVADGATLTVNVHGELLCRLAGLAAWRGELAFAGELKRFRGQATDKPFGEPPDQMHRLVGEGLVVLRAAGRRFNVLELGGEAGYFREAVVFGFQEQVAFENGRLPSAAGGLDLVHLRGRGRLVLVTRGEPVAVEVTQASPVHVPLASLIGWTGALTPRIAPFSAGGVEGEAVEIAGEGRVLVDPGPAARAGEAT